MRLLSYLRTNQIRIIYEPKVSFWKFCNRVVSIISEERNMTKAIMKCNKNGRRRRIGLTYADLHFKKSFQPLRLIAYLLCNSFFFSLLSGQNGCRFNWNRALALLYFKIHSWNIFISSSPTLWINSNSCSKIVLPVFDSTLLYQISVFPK